MNKIVDDVNSILSKSSSVTQRLESLEVLRRSVTDEFETEYVCALMERVEAVSGVTGAVKSHLYKKAAERLKRAARSRSPIAKYAQDRVREHIAFSIVVDAGLAIENIDRHRLYRRAQGVFLRAAADVRLHFPAQYPLLSGWSYLCRGKTAAIRGDLSEGPASAALY
jgi:hypothetical protein